MQESSPSPTKRARTCGLASDLNSGHQELEKLRSEPLGTVSLVSARAFDQSQSKDAQIAVWREPLANDLNRIIWCKSSFTCAAIKLPVLQKRIAARVQNLMLSAISTKFKEDPRLQAWKVSKRLVAGLSRSFTVDRRGTIYWHSKKLIGSGLCNVVKLAFTQEGHRFARRAGIEGFCYERFHKVFRMFAGAEDVETGIAYEYVNNKGERVGCTLAPLYASDFQKFLDQSYSNYENLGVEGKRNVWKLAVSALGTLREFHRRGVTHYDLRPRNVFIKTTGQTVIGDFDLTETESKETPAKPLTGSSGTQGESDYREDLNRTLDHFLLPLHDFTIDEQPLQDIETLFEQYEGRKISTAKMLPRVIKTIQTWLVQTRTAPKAAQPDGRS